MKTYILDIETYKEMILYCFLDYHSDEIIIFEISKNKNELEKIYNFIKNQQLRIVTFNGIHFDSLITNYIITNYQKLKQLSNLDFCSHIYTVSQTVIKEDFHEYSKYKYHKLYEEIDVFLLVSKGLRISKKLSLKFYAYNLDMDIMEMPVFHGKKDLTDIEIDLVRKYVQQDVLVTKELTIKKREEINLRFWIRKEYGLNCLSYDAPKIASELLLDSYCKKTLPNNISIYDYKKEIRNRRYEKPSIKIGDFIPKIEFKTKQFQDLYNRIYNSYNTFSEEIIVKNPDNTFIKIQYGNGGLHGVQNNEKYNSNEEYIYVECDFASLYPNLYINYNFNSPFFGNHLVDIEKEILEQRLDAKKNGRKTEDTTKKLILNSYSGIIDNSYSHFYAPEQALGMRLTGQICITKVLEEFLLLGISAVSANTDSVTVKIKRSELFHLDNIRNTIKQELNLTLEDTFYKFIYYKSVNDYIGYTTDNKIKVKGEFLYEKQLEGSNEFNIIPLALKEFYVNNIPVEQTIKNHSNIFDFTLGKKISKDYSVYYNGEKIQQLNRLYVSKKGAYLYKQKAGKKTMENVLKDTPVCIYNTPDNKTPQELFVDFSYYIKKANMKIMELNNMNQLFIF